MSRVWVDYNSVEPDGLTLCLTEHVEGPLPVKGDPIETFDMEGNVCPAVVTGRAPGVFYVRLALDSFRPALAPRA
jgi:hypothetical protein